MLTLRQKRELKADFNLWSGGKAPDQVKPSTVESFIRSDYAWTDGTLNVKDVRAFLLAWKTLTPQVIRR